MAVKWLFLGAWDGGTNEIWRHYPDLAQRKTRLSDHLFDFFGRFARDYSMSDGEFGYRFELFELLGSLTHVSVDISPEELREALQAQTERSFVGAPVGRIAWHSGIRERAVAELANKGMRGRLLKAGFAGGNTEHYDRSLENLRRIMCRIEHWG